LETALKGLGLQLNQRQKQQLDQYMSFLLEWNQKFNLTAITDPEEVKIKHFYDSLLLLRSSHWQGKGRIADVGSGAGFPGVPLKIIFPELEMVLFDSSAKKVDFLKLLCQALDIDKTEAVHIRAEDAGQNPKYRASFDWVVSRALAPMPVLAEYGLPLLKIGGLMAAYKGPGCQAELTAAEQAVQILGGTYLDLQMEALPQNFGQRNILYFKKTAATPLLYPRKAGMPAKKPL